MKIAVCSDLHLEFGTVELKNENNIDVLILSGDILVERDLDMYDRRQDELGFARNRSLSFHNFFKNVSEQFPHVIYIAGNHEHYHGDFKFTTTELKRKLAYLQNIHVLDKEVFELDDTVFVGGTLWTDMNKEDPMTLHAIKDMMNDFRCVKNSDRQTYRKVPLYKKKDDGTDGYELGEDGFMIEVGMKMKEEPSKFSPVDAVEEHRKMLDYIRVVYEGMPPWKQMVVVGHHTPSPFSCHPKYAGDYLMNGGYHSDLSEFILDRPGIKLWTHGHTHEKFDYEIGDCRVVCNPRGYIGYEEIADGFQLKVVEL
jgi:predicted phosphodiesterase